MCDGSSPLLPGQRTRIADNPFRAGSYVCQRVSQSPGDDDQVRSANGVRYGIGQDKS